MNKWVKRKWLKALRSGEYKQAEGVRRYCQLHRGELVMAKEWTDLDYAQAAIDMLPETVEEIECFLRLHKVSGTPNSATQCPISVWVTKWTGTPTSTGLTTSGPGGSSRRISLPVAVTYFIDEVDRKNIRL